jgi:FixJ family two-component response regulator
MDPVPPAVFVVDDDPSVRKALRRLLTSSGFRVGIFCSAAEFLESGAPRQGGCLVLDIHMPGMNGFELQKKLILLGFDLPVVYITGQDTETMRTEALKCGGAAYFAKPFDNDQLVKSVVEALDSKENKPAGKRT